jgi:hypothetical protein
MRISWNNRGIIDQVQETTSVFSQNDLLLCPLNSGCEVVVISFLELLARL